MRTMTDARADKRKQAIRKSEAKAVDDRAGNRQTMLEERAREPPSCRKERQRRNMEKN